MRIIGWLLSGAVVVGGNAQNGTNAGLAYFNSNYSPASTNANIASHLC